MAKSAEGAARQKNESCELLYQALLDLLKEKKITSITISEICDQAVVSRQTYYRNFKDKTDILRRHILMRLAVFKLHHDVALPRDSALRDFFRDLPLEKDLLRTLYRQDMFYLIYESMQEHLYNELSSNTKSFSCSEEDADFFIYQIADTLAGILYVWTMHGFRESTEELYRLALKLMPAYSFIEDERHK